jgi:hypothetical protein
VAGPNVESARVDPIAAAFRRFALGAVLQFPRTGVVRVSLFLLVPAGLGTDQFPADLAGISTGYPGRSPVNSVSLVARRHRHAQSDRLDSLSIFLFFFILVTVMGSSPRAGRRLSLSET